MAAANYLTEGELNTVKGLIHYLNENIAPKGEAGVALDGKLVDSNGESLGLIQWNSHAGAYTLYPGLG